MRRFWRCDTGRTWTLILLLIGTAGAVRAALYDYADDFSTDKVETDSYYHSAILDSIPPAYLTGILVYHDGECNGRNLAFLRGYLVNARAFLAYRFPLEGPQGEVDSCQVGFTICTSRDWEGMTGEMILQWSGDGDSWTAIDTVDAPGSYLYSVPVPEACEEVYIKFLGSWFLFDDLDISLTISDTSGLDGVIPSADLPPADLRCRVRPNPSAGPVAINYRLPTAQAVRLAIFDPLGRAVYQTGHQWQTSGEHQAVWDAAGVPSGVYYYRLCTGTGVLTGRLLLAR